MNRGAAPRKRVLELPDKREKDEGPRGPGYNPAARDGMTRRKKSGPVRGPLVYVNVSVPFRPAQGRNPGGLKSFLTNHFFGWCLFGVPKPHNEESMTKIALTVGRVVLFTPSRLTGDGRFAHIDCRKPLAAIVSHVFSDELVNLAVFDSNDQSHSRTSVPLLQEGETMPEHGYFCSWMPYQIGQAANAAANDPKPTLANA